jgi:GTP-binding protein YchF
MHLGIIGYPASGKTTLFQLLTGVPNDLSFQSSKKDFHSLQVELPDSRLDALGELLQPKTLTPAKISLTDMNVRAGSDGLSAQTLNQISAMDGFMVVVRAFGDPNIPHIHTSVDPLRDLRELENEFLLHDYAVLERRYKSLEEEKSKGARERGEIEREQDFLQSLSQDLSAEVPLRVRMFSEAETQMITGFGLLSLKPVLVVVNQDEDTQVVEMGDLVQGALWTNVLGKLELEIGQLPEEDAGLFMREYAIEEPARFRILEGAREILSIISFFTFNENELRAWVMKKGGSAVEAAGTIHSDIARGFIRAEVLAWDELIELGGYAEARAAGKLRIEGKKYLVTDGDVIYVRFNI